jgi:hypothetical protein
MTSANSLKLTELVGMSVVLRRFGRENASESFLIRFRSSGLNSKRNLMRLLKYQASQTGGLGLSRSTRPFAVGRRLLLLTSFRRKMLKSFGPSCYQHYAHRIFLNRSYAGKWTASRPLFRTFLPMNAVGVASGNPARLDSSVSHALLKTWKRGY